MESYFIPGTPSHSCKINSKKLFIKMYKLGKMRKLIKARQVIANEYTFKVIIRRLDYTRQRKMQQSNTS